MKKSLLFFILLFSFTHNDIFQNLNLIVNSIYILKIIEIRNNFNQKMKKSIENLNFLYKENSIFLKIKILKKI